MFFVQNAGNPDAGTGVNKSAQIYKISLKEAHAVRNERNATGKVTITHVPATPEVPNPNGKLNSKIKKPPGMKLVDLHDRWDKLQG